MGELPVQIGVWEVLSIPAGLPMPLPTLELIEKHDTPVMQCLPMSGSQALLLGMVINVCIFSIHIFSW